MAMWFYMLQLLCMIHTSHLRQLSSPFQTQFCPTYTMTFKASLCLFVKQYRRLINTLIKSQWFKQHLKITFKLQLSSPFKQEVAITLRRSSKQQIIWRWQLPISIFISTKGTSLAWCVVILHIHEATMVWPRRATPRRHDMIYSEKQICHTENSDRWDICLITISYPLRQYFLTHWHNSHKHTCTHRQRERRGASIPLVREGFKWLVT